MLELIYLATAGLALTGWAGLVLLPGSRFAVRVLARAIIPCAIALVYVYLMASHFDSAPDGGSFGSLAGLKVYFGVDTLLLAAWVHYLALDLFVGSWEVLDARARGIPHLLVVPCLILTVLLGPTGLLAYLLMRAMFARRRMVPARDHQLIS